MKLKLLLTYIILVFFVGCKTKQSISEKVFVKESDSVSTTLQLNTDNTIIIENLCDSITGKPIEFINMVDTGTSSTEIKIKDNQLTANVKSDSIVYVDRNVVKEVFVEKEKDVVRNVVPFKYWVWLILAIAYGLGMTYLWIRK